MVTPPRDTECTDVPGGPRAETWLTTDATGWSVMGWSTGGFCAAKLLLRHPTLFHAAVGIGGYYDAETDKSTGNLFGNDPRLRRLNSPLWLVGRRLRRTTDLLIV